jgi:hypothetical protein
MLLNFKKPITKMTDDDIKDRIDLLETKLEHTGRVVSALKTGNAVIIMGGVLVLGLLSGGLTLLTLLEGLGVGVIAMASIRATAENQSRSLERSRTKELEKLEAEQQRRVVLAAEQQRLALEQQRLAAENAPHQAKALERSIEKDFNEGLSAPVAVGTALSLKKRGLSSLFTPA